jgi:hypothetical protein
MTDVAFAFFLQEKKFCELEEEITAELNRRKVEREKMVEVPYSSYFLKLLKQLDKRFSAVRLHVFFKC